MKSPSLASYLLGFGLPLLIAVAGVVADHGQWRKRYWQLAAWFLLSLGCAYLPFWYQRKLIFGAQIPLCLLGSIAIGNFLVTLKSQRTQKLVLVLAAVICAPLLVASSVYQVAYAQQETRSNLNDTYYVSDEMRAGLEFLKARSNPSDIVLATWPTSRMIPAYAGNTVLWGHWAMSVDFDARRQWYAKLFDKDQDWQNARRSTEFWRTGITYICADGELRRSIEQNPEKWTVILNDTDTVFSNSKVEILRRRNEQP